MNGTGRIVHDYTFGQKHKIIPSEPVQKLDIWLEDEKERAVRARQDASIYRLQLRLQKELSRRSETAENESRRVCA